MSKYYAMTEDEKITEQASIIQRLHNETGALQNRNERLTAALQKMMEKLEYLRGKIRLAPHAKGCALPKKVCDCWKSKV